MKNGAAKTICNLIISRLVTQSISITVVTWVFVQSSIEDSRIDTNGLMGARWTLILKNNRGCDYEINNRMAVAVILK